MSISGEMTSTATETASTNTMSSVYCNTRSVLPLHLILGFSSPPIQMIKSMCIIGWSRLIKSLPSSMKILLPLRLSLLRIQERRRSLRPSHQHHSSYWTQSSKYNLKVGKLSLNLWHVNCIYNEDSDNHIAESQEIFPEAEELEINCSYR